MFRVMSAGCVVGEDAASAWDFDLVLCFCLLLLLLLFLTGSFSF